MKRASEKLRRAMTDATVDMPEDPAPSGKKRAKLPLIIGLVLALAGGAGGFFAVQSGKLPIVGVGSSDMAQKVAGDGHGTATGDGHSSGHGDDHGAESDVNPGPLPDISYVSLDPIIVSLTGERGIMHLRFRAELEVNSDHAHDVEVIRPRITDVLNGYLRALEPEDISSPHALARLRAQMLRRIQIVVGAGRVRDLLIMEFVLN